jgi:hypothetical protein
MGAMIHHHPPYPPDTMYVSQGRLFYLAAEFGFVVLYEVLGEQQRKIHVY